MKEHPILFSTPMVKAILEGRKTQTRRVNKLEGLDGESPYYETREGDLVPINDMCPYGQVGDKLWVRETFYIHSRFFTDDPKYFYKADNPSLPLNNHWRPSIFMPRSASRIALEITKIRVQKLQQISQDDAIAEGLLFMGGIADNWDDAPWCASLKDQEPMKYPSAAYGRLWDSINGKKYPWESNPWVWAISFKKL